MIRQQINLHVIKKKERVPFSAAICALIVLVTAAVVGGLYAYEYSQLQALKQQVAVLKTENSARKDEISSLIASNNARKADPALVAQRDALEKELKERQQYGRTLAKLEPGSTVRFSNLLRGLSNQAVDGVWLTRINATDGGARLQLQGETTTPALIPQYLRKLGSERSYRQARFDDFQISALAQRLQFNVEGVLPVGGDS